MKKYLVRCSYEVEIELPDSTEPYFYIEENHCPGTGSVGLALERVMKWAEENHVCWACCLNGKNEIIKEL